MFPTSSATSASTRLGVCSRFRVLLHHVNASYNILGAGGVPTALSEISGHPEDKWGGSVMAALQIKNIPTGAGDDFKIDASYAKGDTKNVISTSGWLRRASRCSVARAVRVLIRALASARRLMRFTCRLSYRRCYRRHQAGRCLGYPWCVQPQLGSLLVDQPLGQLLARFATTAAARHHLGQGPVLRQLQRRQGRVCRLHLQPGLQRCPGRCDHPLDSRQEPDVLG